MPERRRFFSSPLIQPSKIEVGIGVLGVELQGALIGLDGVEEATKVFKRNAEVEGRGLVFGIELHRTAIMLLGSRRRTILMQKAAEVDVCIDVIGIEL
jgi:hypothetical protein